MNRKINSHVHDHQVGSQKRGAVFVLCPSDISIQNDGLLATLIKKSVNTSCDEHNEESGFAFFSWKLDHLELFPAIASLSRHISFNAFCSIHVCFLSHGEPGKLIWNAGHRIKTREVLGKLRESSFPQLNSVSFLGCSSLQNVLIPKLPFDLVGFKDYVYWDEVPFFVARMIKEYFHGETMKASVSIARKSCKFSNNTAFPKNSIVCRTQALPSTEAHLQGTKNSK